jgi:hypothetical protein
MFFNLVCLLLGHLGACHAQASSAASSGDRPPGHGGGGDYDAAFFAGDLNVTVVLSSHDSINQLCEKYFVDFKCLLASNSHDSKFQKGDTITVPQACCGNGCLGKFCSKRHHCQSQGPSEVPSGNLLGTGSSNIAMLGPETSPSTSNMSSSDLNEATTIGAPSSGTSSSRSSVVSSNSTSEPSGYSTHVTSSGLSGTETSVDSPTANESSSAPDTTPPSTSDRSKSRCASWIKKPTPTSSKSSDAVTSTIPTDQVDITLYTDAKCHNVLQKVSLGAIGACRTPVDSDGNPKTFRCFSIIRTSKIADESAKLIVFKGPGCFSADQSDRQTYDDMSAIVYDNEKPFEMGSLSLEDIDSPS